MLLGILGFLLLSLLLFLLVLSLFLFNLLFLVFFFIIEKFPIVILVLGVVVVYLITKL